MIAIIVLLYIIIQEMGNLEIQNKNVKSLLIISICGFLILLILILKLFYTFIRSSIDTNQVKITKFFQVTNKNN